jgi:hypothetical protein
MIGMVFLTNCSVVLLTQVFDWYLLTSGQMLLVHITNKNGFFTNHLLEMWHHLMITRGTIGMLPHDNVIYCHVTTLCFATWQHTYGATCQHIVV